MSWGINIAAVPKELFEDRLDEAQPGGQPAEAVAEVVAKAKTVAKELAKLITRPEIAAQLSGHVLIEGERGPTWYEGVTVTVSGSGPE